MRFLCSAGAVLGGALGVEVRACAARADMMQAVRGTRAALGEGEGKGSTGGIDASDGGGVCDVVAAATGV